MKLTKMPYYRLNPGAILTDLFAIYVHDGCRTKTATILATFHLRSTRYKLA